MKLHQSNGQVRVVIGPALAIGMLLFPGVGSGQIAGQIPPPGQPPNLASPGRGTADGLHTTPAAARRAKERTEDRRPNARRGGNQGDHHGDRRVPLGGPAADDDNSSGWLGQLLREQFDLRLMSWGDGSRVPISGSQLVIIGVDNNDLLHIRIFDARGKGVLDTNETKLSEVQAVAIATLKRALAGLLPSQELTGARKAQVMRKVRSIVGREGAMRRLSKAPHHGQPRRSRTTRSRSRNNVGSSPNHGITESNGR